MTKQEKKEVKRLRELLVRHIHRADMLTMNLEAMDRTLGVKNLRLKIERERRRYWNAIKKADSRLLRIADEQLNRRERRLLWEGNHRERWL